MMQKGGNTLPGGAGPLAGWLIYEDSRDYGPKNSEIIQESSRISLSHNEEDCLRRERKIIYEDSGDSCQ